MSSLSAYPCLQRCNTEHMLRYILLQLCNRLDTFSPVTLFLIPLWSSSLDSHLLASEGSAYPSSHNYTRLNHAFCARYVIKSETAALITDRHYVTCSGTVYGYDISCHMLFLSATDCNEQARTVVAAYNNKIIIYLLVILLIC